MKHLLMSAIAIPLFLSQSTLAATVTCQAENAALGGKKMDVPVTILQGAQNTKPKEIQFEGSKFSVVWQKGDNFEKQPWLSLNFGDLNSTMYDFSMDNHKGPISIVSKGDLRLQCWVE